MKFCFITILPLFSRKIDRIGNHHDAYVHVTRSVNIGIALRRQIGHPVYARAGQHTHNSRGDCDRARVITFEFLHPSDATYQGARLCTTIAILAPFRGIEARPIDRNGDSYDSSIARWINTDGGDETVRLGYEYRSEVCSRESKQDSCKQNSSKD